MELHISGEVVVEESSEATTDTEGNMAGHNMDAMTQEPQIHVAAQADGGVATVRFTPITSGEYEFSCTVIGHKEAGMVGALVVSAP